MPVGASCEGDAVFHDGGAFGLESFLGEASYFDAPTHDPARAANNSSGAYFGYAGADAPHSYRVNTANAVDCGG